MLKHISTTVHKITSVLQTMYDNPTSGACEDFIQNCATTIASHLDATNAQLLVDNHTDPAIFQAPPYGKKKLNDHITDSFWRMNSVGQPAALVRSILSIGPAANYLPSGVVRDNQGILCQPNSSNHGKTPIEFLAHVHLMEVIKPGGHVTADTLFNTYIDLFTNTGTVHNDKIEEQKITFVKGIENTTTSIGNRLDIVNTLRLAYLIGLVVYFSNPTQFKHYHPIHVITRIFLAQKNFFLMDHVSEFGPVQQHNYLLSLGIQVYETIRKSIDPLLLLNNRALYSSAPLMLTHRHEQPEPSEHTDRFFLFGIPSTEGASELNCSAQPLDASTLEFYNNALNQEDLDSYYVNDIINLITMVCPKEVLPSHSARKFGIKNKPSMIALLRDHIATFHANNAIQAYIDGMPTE
jgi:hypothetical protein